MQKNKTDYVDVTEISGDEVSQEQVIRMYQRYYWAKKYCLNKDVIEVACGTGQGLGFLAHYSRKVIGADYSEKILDIARKHYGDRIKLLQFNAEKLPFENESFDCILIFEAIYYLSDPNEFIKECVRVLRPQGKLLIVSANKDLFDFNPSPYSYKYFGVVELNQLLNDNKFTAEFFGGFPINELTLSQKILRLLKKIAVMINVIPKSMAGKKFLKRLVFGQMTYMPPEIREGMCKYDEPQKLSELMPSREYKVIFCEATKN